MINNGAINNSATFDFVNDLVNSTANNLQNNINGKLSATQSKASNGWVKFSNGIIIQWLRPSIGENANTSFNLPTPFTSSNYSVAVAINSSSSDDLKTINVHSLTTTKFNLRNTMSGSFTVYCIAVGY